MTQSNKHGHPWYEVYETCGCKTCFNTRRAIARRGRRKRKNRWGHQRKRVYTRDEFKCVKCGSTENLTLDLAVPRADGGKTTDDNLQTMCKPCNSKKAATTAFYGALAEIHKDKIKNSS